MRSEPALSMSVFTPCGHSTLTFTPAANANGSSLVTVIVQDNGGTANGGIDKATLKRRLWGQSKLAAHRLTAKDYLRIGHARRGQLGEIGRETMIPISNDPGGVGIIVAGGPGTHSVYLPISGHSRSSTRPIDGDPAPKG